MDTRKLSVFAFIAVLSLVAPNLGFSLDNLGFNLEDFDKAIGERDTGTGQSAEKTLTMGTWMLPVSAFLAVSSFVTPNLFSRDNLGFNPADIGTGQTTEGTPADVLVDHLLELFDSNNDGEVELAEVRQRLNRLPGLSMKSLVFQHGNGQPQTSAEFRRMVYGPVMTVATLIDADDSGILDRNELERASSTLVRETGSPVVVATMMLVLSINEGQDITLNDEVVTGITNALDTNENEAISYEELTVLSEIRRFRMNYETLVQADQDRNESLNGAELREWLELLNEEDFYSARRLRQFGMIAARLGRDVALQWASGNY